MALAHAILASLLGQPQTGYDLAKQFGSEGFFWRASHQQIYRELTRLETEGAISPINERPGARGERRLTATIIGQALLVEWCSQPSDPATIKEDILVKCLSLGITDPENLVEDITRHRDRHEARWKNHRDVLAEHFPRGAPSERDQLGRYLALLAGVSYEQAWIDWADTAIKLAKDVR